MYPPLSSIFLAKSDPSPFTSMSFVNSKHSYIYYNISIKSSPVCIIINHKQLISVIPYRPMFTYLHLSIVSATMMLCFTDLIFIFLGAFVIHFNPHKTLQYKIQSRIPHNMC